MATASTVLNVAGVSIADSKAVLADSKASSAAVVAAAAKGLADSAVGSEPGAGQYIMTDIKVDATGSVVFEYNDSAIGS